MKENDRLNNKIGFAKTPGLSLIKGDDYKSYLNDKKQALETEYESVERE
jgi:hypothetical protein